MNDTNRPLAVGDTLHGYCGGAFGRDHYDCCTIEALGPDWVVTRNANGGLDFTSLLDRLPAHRQPTTDVNGDPCCQQTPTVSVRYMPSVYRHPADCPDCMLTAAASPALAAAFDQWLTTHHGPGPAFTNPTPPAQAKAPGRN